jgi:hypothetical protein
MTSTDPFNTARLDESPRLSPGGVIRKADIARSLQRELATSVRNRRIARAAAASVPVVAIAAALVLLLSSGAPSSSVSPRHAHRPVPAPSLPPTVINVVYREPSPPSMRHASFTIAISKPLDIARIVDDSELTGVLAKSGISAGIVRLADRTIIADNATGKELRFAGPADDKASQPPAGDDAGSGMLPSESPRDSAA